MGTTTDKRRFGGIERLYGPEAAGVFRASHVLIVGVGGVGSWATEALARAGIGRFTLVDGDVTEESNTNRQCHALEGNYGRNKAQLTKERILLINPGAEVAVIPEMISPESIASLPKADAVIDAIDSLRAKAALVAWASKSGAFTVTSGGGAGRTDPSMVSSGDTALVRNDPLISALRKSLRSDYGFPKGDPKGKSKKFGIPAVYSEEPVRRPEGLPEGAGLGTVMTVTAAFGMQLAALVLNELGKKGTKNV